MDYSLHLTSQLREHLRALRKARGLTQAALGQMLGVGQARIAEIEGNPGVVSVEQLMRVLSALRAYLVVRNNDALEVIANQSDAVPSSSPAPANKLRKPAKQPTSKVPPIDVASPSGRSVTIRPRKGSW